MSLQMLVLPILFTLFFWWFSTGIILYLDGLPQRTFRWSLGAASVVLIAALYGLYTTANDPSVGAAYCAFTCAVLVWGWLEMSFLMGFIVGTRRTPCPPTSSGWRRACYSFEAIVYHELALLGGALLVAVATWGATNRLGIWTFFVLWISRLSTKLNLFLGVRNFGEEFLPQHLAYLHTYFTRRTMNLLFPISVTVTTLAAMKVWQAALSAQSGEAVGLAFLGTLIVLAIIEHWFLMLPIKFGALWEWGLESRRASLPASPLHKVLGSDARARLIPGAVENAGDC